MKHSYLLLVAFFTFFYSQAQIDFPDPNLKEALVNHLGGVIDTNADGEIQSSEALEFTGTLQLQNSQISNMSGIENFFYITELLCQGNLLTSLDVTSNPYLERLECWDNQITSLNLSQNLELGGLLCTRNLLTELDLSANTELIELWCDDNLLTSLDLTAHPLLDVVFCDGNMLETLDLSQNSLLTTFQCNDNVLTEIILPEISILEDLGASNNNLTTIDFSNQPYLIAAGLNNNQLTTLDFSSNALLSVLRLDNIPQLTTLFLKNGSVLNFSSFDLEGTENIEFICADQFEINQIKTHLTNYGYNDVVVNSYCSFVPGGEVSVVEGACYYDVDDNGCSVGDPVFPLLKYLVSNGTTSEYFYNDVNGHYFMSLQEGSFTITPIVQGVDYYTVSPSVVSLDLPESSNPYPLDFCIVGDDIYNDVEVYIIPLGQARPGFNVEYKVIYKNNGNFIMTGSVEFNFDNNYVEYVSATQTPDIETVSSLTWNYASLQPFESREITVTVNLNTPTDPNFPLNGGDELGFQSIITPIAGDAYEEDNITSIKRQVVNSFDPNDKTCLEGETIEPDMVGEYVHYLIRFENTGTADAINIVVKDVIDTNKFDIDKLVPLYASHDFVARITNTNEVEFIFENINLPFDDANNDGYVVFKIKTLPTLALGDTFTNDAEIYFDYNAPIITNDFLTTVAEPLSVGEAHSNSFKFYPNPVKDDLYVESEFGIRSATVYDVNGRLLHLIAFTDHALKQGIDVGKLSKGIYFMRIVSDGGEVVEKIVRE